MKKGVISFVSVLASAFIGAGAGAGAALKIKGKEMDRVQNMSNKHLALFLMMNQWVKVKQEDKHLADYFMEHGYQNIAVYGMGYAGETLLDELKGSNVQVSYGIDEKTGREYAGVAVLSPEDILDDIDLIVVTAVSFFDEIHKKLRGKVSCPVISLEDILYEI